MPTAKKSQSKPRRSSLKEQNAKLTRENNELRRKLQARDRDLTEALEQQTATSEVLRVISSSPTDVQPVFETILADAVRLCESHNGAIFKFDGEALHLAADYNTTPEFHAYQAFETFRPGRESAVRRVALERRLVHIPDVLADPELVAYRSEPYRQEGMRSVLAVPLLKETNLIGAIAIYRKAVRPFSQKQIKLLETFADQAVIAIENVRLFQELQVRNRDLTEALEQQTATSEILRVIASSPTELQPVFDEILVNAARLCDAKAGTLFLHDDDTFRAVALCGATPAWAEWVRNPIRPGPDTGLARLVRERKPIHIADILAEPIDRESQPNRVAAIEGGARTGLHVPMLKEQSLIGAINIYRHEVRPFTDNQIKLLETFASQAVIAIENVRLFKELKESLEQQTATSEILGVIASSPTDLQPVLNAVAENAARLCDASEALIFRVNGDRHQRVASYGSMPVLDSTSSAMSRGGPVGRAILDQQTIHVHDLAASESDFPDAQTRGVAMGVRTALIAPLLRENVSIGAIYIRRKEVRPFTDKQIKLA